MSLHIGFNLLLLESRYHINVKEVKENVYKELNKNSLTIIQKIGHLTTPILANV
jgi:hypothetical protein